MQKIRVFTAFSGYDSQCLALDRLQEKFPNQFSYQLVGWSEIDKYAIAAHNAIYPQWADRNYGDIAQIDWLQVPNFDLFTYSFPCQAVSNAGKRGGLTEGSGTTSSLLWECRRAIECKRPRICLMENVKNLVSKKFMPEFRKWIETTESFGYKNFWKVLNAKHFGVPQNRERVFMISILDRGGLYTFSEGFPLTLRLKDILEKNVPESYYLKQKQIDHIIAHCERKVAEGCGFKTNFQDENGISGAIKTKEGSREYDTYIKEEIISRQDAIEYTPTKDGGITARDIRTGSAISEGMITSIEAEVAPTITSCQRTRIIDPPLLIDNKGITPPIWNRQNNRGWKHYPISTKFSKSKQRHSYFPGRHRRYNLRQRLQRAEIDNCN